MELTLLFLPLLSFIISGFFGKYLGDRISEIITSLFVSISAVIALIVFYNVITQGYENNIVIATWFNSGPLNVNWSIKVDALSASNACCRYFNIFIGSYLFNRLHVSMIHINQDSWLTCHCLLLQC